MCYFKIFLYFWSQVCFEILFKFILFLEFFIIIGNDFSVVFYNYIFFFNFYTRQQVKDIKINLKKSFIKIKLKEKKISDSPRTPMLKWRVYTLAKKRVLQHATISNPRLPGGDDNRHFLNWNVFNWFC